jgi:hypothetical protein
MPSYAAPWPRSKRRALSRQQARHYAFYNGPQPRHEPASDPVCTTHHRRLPCTRCTQATS